MIELKKLLKSRYTAGKNHRWLRIKQHPFMLPVVVFMALFFASLIAFVGFGARTLRADDSHVVIVSYDKKQQVVPTRATDVADLLKRLNIEVHEGDIVEPQLDAPIVEDNFRVNVYRARPVTIIDDGRRTLAFNAATTPRSIAAQAGVSVFPEDKIDTKPVENVLADGIAARVVIERSKPANLNVYGSLAAVRTHAKTVGDLLKEKNVQLGPEDSVKPAFETPLTANLQIFVNRNGVQFHTESIDLASETQYVDDPSLSFGTTATRQQGSAGKKQVTYQIDTQNGQETGRKVIQEIIVVAPVQTIIARGKAVSIPGDKTSIMAAAGVAESDYPYANYIISRENSLWCATRWQGQNYCPAYYEEIHNPNGPDASGRTYGLGLCQATPAGKMASAGADWQANPVTQMRWCSGYAHSRYGSWEAAYNFWSAHHWW